MKNRVKLLSFIIGLSLILIPLTNIKAHNSYNVELNDNKINNQKYQKNIDVEINGKTYTIVAESNIPFDNHPKISPTGLYPKYPIGTRKYVTLYLSRNFLSNFGTITNSAVGAKALSQAIKKALNKAVPGLGYIAVSTSLIAGGMGLCGINGIVATVHLKYISHYYHMGGYYVYVWDITKIALIQY